MGFNGKTWNEWFNTLFSENGKISEKEVIEQIFKKGTLKYFYETWVKNFANNLENIWDSASAKELIPNNIEPNSSAIVIGRGPSKIEFENPNEEVAENLVLAERGQYICKACNATIAEYRNF